MHEKAGGQVFNVYSLSFFKIFQVKVLRGGFEGWHAKYRKEPDLIENYDKSIWGIYDELDAEEQQDNPDFPGIPKQQAFSFISVSWNF